MSRLLIVANRLPVTVRATERGVEVQRSAGGLATGLMRPHEQSDGLWIGWAGASDLDPASRRRSTASSRRCGWSASRSRPISWAASTRASNTLNEAEGKTRSATGNAAPNAGRERRHQPHQPARRQRRRGRVVGRSRRRASRSTAPVNGRAPAVTKAPAPPAPTPLRRHQQLSS